MKETMPAIEQKQKEILTDIDLEQIEKITQGIAFVPKELKDSSMEDRL